jgi:hypothetical protein
MSHILGHNCRTCNRIVAYLDSLLQCQFSFATIPSEGLLSLRVSVLSRTSKLRSDEKTIDSIHEDFHYFIGSTLEFTKSRKEIEDANNSQNGTWK